MLDQYGRELLANVLEIPFHDGGFVHMNFVCIFVDHTVSRQSVGFRAPWVFDFLQVLTQPSPLD